ncbi:tetratricopeptide-like helical domain-containing protein [Tanacetum coccineum]
MRDGLTLCTLVLMPFKWAFWGGTHPALVPCLRFCPDVTFLSSQIHSNSSSSNVDGHTQSKFQKVANLDDALNLFDKMSQRRPLPSVVEFTQLLQSVTKMKHFSHSLDMFKQMCALRVPVNDYTMNIVIKCCCHLYRTNEAFAVFGWNFKRGIIPDVVTFNTLLNGLVLEHKILEAEIFFKKLIKDKLCRWEVASKMLQEMLDVGISPNVHTFNILVDAFCKDGRVEEAEDVINIMLDRGIVPDIVTWNGDRSGTGSRYGIAVRYFLKFGTTGGRLYFGAIRFG